MNREEFNRRLVDLISRYHPAASAEKIKNVQLLMLVGPSGAGKSTLINNMGLRFVPSDTTRKARPGERDGQEFYFLTDYDKVTADIKAGKFLQVAIGPAGDFYATRTTSYPDSGVAVMPVMADVLPVFRGLGFKRTLSAFIVPPTFEEWMRRMGSRQLPEEQLSGRLAEAERSLSLALNDPEMAYILNDEISAAISQLRLLLEGKKDERLEATARKTAEELLNRLALKRMAN